MSKQNIDKSTEHLAGENALSEKNHTIESNKNNIDSEEDDEEDEDYDPEKKNEAENEGGVSSDEEEDNDQYKDGKTLLEILKLIRKQDLSRISRISMLIQYLKI